MNPTQTTPLEPGNRIQLPAEWANALGLRGRVALERTSDGLLVRPSPRLTWDEVFEPKLVIGSAPPEENQDDVEFTWDDFLFETGAGALVPRRTYRSADS
jgi:hypothetical protein